MRQMQPLIIIGCLLLLTLQVGCGRKTTNINYYSLVANTPQVETQPAQQLPISVGIGPIRLPQLLNRPHLVTRSETYQVQHAESERWSGDLQEEITHALADNLSRQLGTEKITIYPWPKSFSPDWQLRVNIQRLDGELGKVAYLEARWTLSREKNDLTLTGVSHHKKEIKETSYEALVAAESQLLENFSQEISEIIRTQN